MKTVPAVNNKSKKFSFFHMCKTWGQCCGSGMFIPDPDFYPSRIPKQHQKRGVKFFFVIPFIVATNFTKLKII